MKIILDFLMFTHIALGLVAIVIAILMYVRSEDVYIWYHKKLDTLTSSDDKEAFMILTFIHIGNFLFYILGLFTYNWPLYIPTILIYAFPKKYRSNGSFKLQGLVSVLMIMLAILNYSHFHIKIS